MVSHDTLMDFFTCITWSRKTSPMNVGIAEITRQVPMGNDDGWGTRDIQCLVLTCMTCSSDSNVVFLFVSNV